MKRKSGHLHAGLRRRVGTDTVCHSTRRALLSALWAGALSALPLASRAQPARIPRIGAINGSHRDAFRQGLREHGWIDGKNIIVEFRTADAMPERRAAIAREFIDLKVECIVAAGNLSISALKQATTGIPLVMAFAADVVASGFVANLRRPGGIITGLTNINEELTGKRLELLKEVNPGMSRVAVLIVPAITAHQAMWKEAQSSARALGFRVFVAEYRSADEIEAAFAAIGREKAEGLLVPQSPIASSARARIISLAASRRLPAVYQNVFWVEDGGLTSYGADEADMWRRSAAYVDKILKGAKPADLPVEQPTKFEWAINLRTAKALGITVPQSILLRADKVIE